MSGPDPFECICCGRGVPYANFEYHDMGLCGECARRAGAAYILSHSGQPSMELDPAAYRAWSDQRRAANKGMYKKKEIAPNKRVKVWRRDGFACVRCGSTGDLTVDHIHPESRGGSSDLDNLQTLCRPCNSSKGVRVA